MSRAVGQNQENNVVDILRQSGWCILCQNYYTTRGEVDIVAQFSGLNDPNFSHGEIAIVEVKYRRVKSSWSFNVVPNRKRLALCRVAQAIEDSLESGLIQHSLEITGYQFVVVLVEGLEFQIVWNAFDDILG